MQESISFANLLASHETQIGASLFASNIGSGHFIGLAGAGAANGIGMSVFELNAIFILMILGWVFVPVYTASGVFTMPEYLSKRFGGQRIRVYLAVLALLLSIFTKVSADLFAGAIFLKLALGWSLYAAIILLLAIAALFAILGGLTAVIWTDFIQTVIMLIGAFYLMIKSFLEVGGYQGVLNKYPTAYPNTTVHYMAHPELNYSYTACGKPPDNAFHLIRSPEDPDLPWPGVFFGLTISAVWYWCSDQVIVQRALAAKNLSHAKAGCILAGYLKFLPMWLMVVPGMISRIIFKDSVGCADPDICLEECGSTSGCSNYAYPKLVLLLMPSGARGLMIAVMMSALMSSLTSIFNSSSTLFTMDIWRRIRRNCSEAELMIVGRVFVLFMVGVGIAWIPIVQSFSELFHYIQSVTSFLAPPICAVYVLAVLWGRINEQGAFWGLMVGLVIGLIRFITESCYPRVPCGDESTVPSVISRVHYLHFGILLFGIVCIVTIVISMLTEPIDEKHLVRLLFWNRNSSEERIDMFEPQSSRARRRAGAGIDNPAMRYDGSTGQIEATNGASIEPERDMRDAPCWKRSAYWVCGIEKTPEVELTEDEQRALDMKNTSLVEVSTWKRANNINAVILITFAVFVWGFFA
ncbi:Sodium/glucose cotransporter 4 [Lamellibrachia satsuma]|nr:Sodium/glucose cotransporter 4 [Lamellibrachia satsuma]